MAKDTKNPAPMTLSTAPNVVDLPAALIVADSGFNVRTNMNPDEVKELAKTIKREGQLQPVLVRKHKDGKFHLVFGFRRFLAITGKEKDGFLERDTIRATILDELDDPTKMAIDDHFNNAIENLAREDLSTYDLGTWAKNMQETYALSGAQIANRVRLSDSYINNLIRILKEASPKIVKRWKDENSPGFEGKTVVCSVPWMLKTVSSCKDKAAQDIELEIALGIRKPPEDDADGDGAGGGGSGNGAGSTSVKRATLSQMEKAMEAIAERKKSDTKLNATDVAELDAMHAALMFASGKRKSLKGATTGVTFKIPPKAGAQAEE